MSSSPDAAAVAEAVRLGDELRVRRLELGQTQQEVAERAGISVATLREVEHGRRLAPYKIRDIRRALGMQMPQEGRPLAGVPEKDLIEELAERLEMPVDEVQRQIDAARRRPRPPRR